MFVTITACGGGGTDSPPPPPPPPQDTTAPTVLSVSPADTTTDVALNTTIGVTFSEAMDPASFTTTSFTVSSGGGVVAGTVSTSSSATTFTPTSSLADSTTYTATITTAATDLAGNPLAASYSWSFTTGAAQDTTAPDVSSVFPSDTATGVLLNTTISATFSEAMDPTSLTTTSFTVSGGGGVVAGTVSTSGSATTFTPTSNLAGSTTYTVTITTAVTDLAGNPLATPYSWSFTTENASPTYGLETRAPIGGYLNGTVPDGGMPLLLSQTGAFTDMTTLTPNPALIPYGVNSSLWSDGTVKTRWIAVPNDGAPYDTNERVGFAPTGAWSFPAGTVLVKNFSLVVNEITGEQRRLETRILASDANGNAYGMTYKWRADQSDADALPNGATESYTVTTATGTRTQTHTYPSTGQCQECHNPTAVFVLGPKTTQLNGPFSYPNSVDDNQLRAWNNVELFNPALDETAISGYARMYAVDDTSVSTETRARSYLDSNCAHCHRPGGAGPTFDGRYETPLENQNIIWTIAGNITGIGGDVYVVQPRDLDRSTLYQRANSVEPAVMMPPLAKHHIDTAGVALLAEWINGMLTISNVTGSGNQVEVIFSQAVEPTTATTATNYVLDGGVTITGAGLGADQTTVTLTTDQTLTAGTTYILTVSNVQDTALAPFTNTISPTAYTFTVP